MKRNKPKEYAEAFLSALRGKSVPEQKNLIRTLLDVAIRRGEQKLLPRVVSEIIASIEKKERETTAHIEIADKRHTKRYGEEIKRTLALLGAGSAAERVSAHPSVIGGFRIRYGEKLYDASHRRHLLDLYRRLAS